MKRGWKKALYIALGSLCLFLGALGILLPLLPTTPFWLLTAYFYLNASERLYRKVMQIPLFGSTVQNFRKYRAIPLRAKVTSITILWAGNILSMILIDRLWVICFLAALSAAVTAHILSYKTLHKEEMDN